MKNSASGGKIGSGGAIGNAGTLNVIHSIFSNNSASGTDQYGQGGAIDNQGKLTVVNSTFSNNQVMSNSGSSMGGGGGIINISSSLAMVAASTFSGNIVINGLGGGGIANDGELTVDQSTFSNNETSGSSSYGGGIINSGPGIASVTASIFSGNSVSSSQQYSQGGAIDNEGKLTVTQSTFSKNTVSGIDSYGGGILNFTTGILVVVASTFSGNTADGQQSSGGGGIGTAGQFTMVASTLWMNVASGPSNAGGGIFAIDSDSPAVIRFCTIYGNTSSLGGGIATDPSGGSRLTIGTSIIAANSASDSPDLDGMVLSDGYNLISNLVGAEGLNMPTDKQVALSNLKINPMLGENGGPTQTLALLPESVAIDVIPKQYCSVTLTDALGHTVVITTDQRGDPRPDGTENVCDVGAYESSY